MSDQEPDSPQSREDRSRWMQFAAMGVELAGMTIACLGLGYLVDYYLEAQTLYGSAFGALVGFSFAMFRFIQKATAL
ncbi:hypothetical protein Pla22_49120 [Rubripirellula amarantea]|uniref:F0F1-ATPase subunit n=1 Tax=Rubripirellula amarantea TaxID=2527999 RepID=A0A5C5WIR4_9BACT|nr:hypothetical protein [Rubripirellula amarantea]TWT49712.1 hypothetical protein Pla22_49120 [Rubripirellula amarantea]